MGGYLSIGLALAAAVVAVSPASRLLLDRVPASDAPLRTLARAQVREPARAPRRDGVGHRRERGPAPRPWRSWCIRSACRSTAGSRACSARTSTCARLPSGDAVVFPPEAQAAHRRGARRGPHRPDPLRPPDRRWRARGRSPLIARPRGRALLRGFQADPAVVPPRSGAVAGVGLGGGGGPARLARRAGGHAAARGPPRRPFRIAGIFRDYSRTWGALLVDLADYRRAHRRPRSPTTSPSTSPPAPTSKAVERARGARSLARRARRSSCTTRRSSTAARSRSSTAPSPPPTRWRPPRSSSRWRA